MVLLTGGEALDKGLRSGCPFGPPRRDAVIGESIVNDYFTDHTDPLMILTNELISTGYLKRVAESAPVRKNFAGVEWLNPPGKYDVGGVSRDARIERDGVAMVSHIQPSHRIPHPNCYGVRFEGVFLVHHDGGGFLGGSRC
jgi:hypothetical protein